MPKRHLDVDEIIKNIFDYFTEAKNNGGPLRSLQQVHKRVCEATGITKSKNTITFIKNYTFVLPVLSLVKV
jgi:hypothetical protein